MSMGFGATEMISNLCSDQDHLGDQKVTSLVAFGPQR